MLVFALFNFYTKTSMSLTNNTKANNLEILLKNSLTVIVCHTPGKGQIKRNKVSSFQKNKKITIANVK